MPCRLVIFAVLDFFDFIEAPGFLSSIATVPDLTAPSLALSMEISLLCLLSPLLRRSLTLP